MDATVDAAGGLQSYRAVFISDLHLGSRGCEAELLLDFIRSLHCDTLYLVGDIVDGWRLKRSWFWPQPHNDVIQKLLRTARKSVRVVYIPGNHDDIARHVCGLQFGGVEVAMETVHEAADGRRYLVTHGDLYEGVSPHSWLVTFLGDWAYRGLVRANSAWARARRRLGLGYWSLAAHIKRKAGAGGSVIDQFERNLADEARRRGLDGVICGHIHHPNLRDIDGVLYVNDGDWVENCTAAVEHFDGRLELISWAGRLPAAVTEPAARPAPLATPQPAMA